MDISNLNGAYAESQFAIYAMENGWEVAKPLIEAVPYDMIIRRSPGEPWETVQVKHAYRSMHDSGRSYLTAGMRRGGSGSHRNKKYKEGDFDWLFVFHKEGRWLFPWDLIKNKRSAIRAESKTYDLWRV